MDYIVILIYSYRNLFDLKWPTGIRIDVKQVTQLIHTQHMISISLFAGFRRGSPLVTPSRYFLYQKLKLPYFKL